MGVNGKDCISPEDAKTLPGLLRERVKISPESVAYKQFDEIKGEWRAFSWLEVSRKVATLQAAFKREDINSGDRVALLLKNSVEWAIFDQAAMALGLVVVPLYLNDSPGDIEYIINNSGAKLLVLESYEMWESLARIHSGLTTLEIVVLVKSTPRKMSDTRLRSLHNWAREGEGGDDFEIKDMKPGDLATIVYTSGTTGPSKGVMLSHRNILSNANACLLAVSINADDTFLSFLPLSHTFERTVGYYLPIMAGATVCYARSVKLLGEDLLTVKPTVLVSVPLIFQRVYDKIMAKLEKESFIKVFLFNTAVNAGWNNFLYTQGRQGWRPSLLLWPVLSKLVGRKVMEGFGGRIDVSVCGGAPLPFDVGRLFIALGLPLLQGFGMTETSPVVTVNKLDDNIPESAGLPLHGVDVSISETGEIIVGGEGAMLGYWNNEKATKEILDGRGRIRTGDIGELKDGHLYITGRIKHIIVMSSGEKVPPADIENRVGTIKIFDQILVIGENRPFLSLIANTNGEKLQEFLMAIGMGEAGIEALADDQVKARLLEIVNGRLEGMPSYARIRNIFMTLEPWTVENGMMTPTLKLKRKEIVSHYDAEIEKLYKH